MTFHHLKRRTVKAKKTTPSTKAANTTILLAASLSILFYRGTMLSWRFLSCHIYLDGCRPSMSYFYQLADTAAAFFSTRITQGLFFESTLFRFHSVKVGVHRIFTYFGYRFYQSLYIVFSRFSLENNCFCERCALK